MKNKKKTGIILLCILLVILIILCGVWFAFRKQISFLYRSYTQISDIGAIPKEDVAARQEENDKKTQQLSDALSDIAVRDLTEEERAALAKGELSEEDALLLILGETVPAVPPAETADRAQPDTAAETTAQNAGSPTPDTQDLSRSTAEKDAAARAAKKRSVLAEIYLLRAEFLNRIDALIDNAIVRYKALPKEKRGTVAKLNIGQALMADGEDLETECDGRMQALLDRLRALLVEGGEPTDILNEIEDAYKEQKQLKKVELINKYVPENLQKKIFGASY
ncbi:MAG: hypothetical protein IJS44_00475 [Clostridia bacterium]|nr:hypothetical protein [Clostridia bacterium]